MNDAPKIDFSAPEYRAAPYTGPAIDRARAIETRDRAVQEAASYRAGFEAYLDLANSRGDRYLNARELAESFRATQEASWTADDDRARYGLAAQALEAFADAQDWMKANVPGELRNGETRQPSAAEGVATIAAAAAYVRLVPAVRDSAFPVGFWRDAFDRALAKGLRFKVGPDGITFAKGGGVFSGRKKVYAYRAAETTARWGRRGTLPGWILRDRVLFVFLPKAERIARAASTPSP